MRNVAGMDVERKDRANVEREFVASLARGLAVVRAFSKDAREMTLSEVAQRTGLTRAAARRFLLTLAALGYVASDGRRFRLTPKVLDLGFSYLSSMELWDVAMPYMEEVSATIHESCSASVLEGCDIVYVARVPTKRIMSVALGIGARLPAITTSMGRVLLAHLEDDVLARHLSSCPVRRHTAHTVTNLAALRDILRAVRQQGWCLVDQELEEGLISIAVPVRNQRGRVLAAMNASTDASRKRPDEVVRNYLPVLQRAAGKIAAALP
jgi:IclR family transcriptional regulator, pca regulon regulatory protein